MYLSYQNGKIVGYTAEPQDLILYNLDKVEETQDEYVLDGDCYVLKDEAWEEKQVLIEKERIARLFLTGADVERGIYKAKGMDFEDIVNMVNTLQPEGLDVKALKIELKANNFYRGNPYVDAVGTLLGFTGEMLDKFFETNDYTYLIPPVVEEPEIEEPIKEPVQEPVEEENEDTTYIQENTEA